MQKLFKFFLQHHYLSSIKPNKETNKQKTQKFLFKSLLFVAITSRLKIEIDFLNYLMKLTKCFGKLLKLYFFLLFNAYYFN